MSKPKVSQIGLALLTYCALPYAKPIAFVSDPRPNFDCNFPKLTEQDKACLAKAQAKRDRKAARKKA